MLDFDAAPIGTRFKRLTEAGVELPAPESLDDAALHAKLWEVIKALAGYDTFLLHTDHLSDRQLYEYLWDDGLREENPMFPPGSGWRNYIDLIGSGSDEHIELGLRYYDCEETRRQWAKDFPGMVIPPHEDPPYDRDQHLPKAEEDEASLMEWCDDEEEEEGEEEEV